MCDNKWVIDGSLISKNEALWGYLKQKESNNTDETAKKDFSLVRKEQITHITRSPQGDWEETTEILVWE